MTIFKSINIVEDFAFPARASHYRPTSKSMDIVQAVIGEGGSRATSIIATYGSGKSLAAMVGGLIVGLVEPFSGRYMPPGYSQIMPYAIMLMVLILRPNGLFAQVQSKKV